MTLMCNLSADWDHSYFGGELSYDNFWGVRKARKDLKHIQCVKAPA